MVNWRTAITLLSRLALGAWLLLCAACAPTTAPGLPRGFDGPHFAGQPDMVPTAQLSPAQGEVIGSGPVRVALILPLSGGGDAAGVGRSMANGARLAMELAGRGGAGIHIVLKDSGAGEARARAATREAVSEGASLILGPLRASAVEVAGEVALAANIPLIGFSNTSSVARPGVYLLSVLPEVEIMRVLSYARSQGRRSAVALVPANAHGEVMGAAFRQAASELGMPVHGVFSFSDEAQARRHVEQLAPQLLAGAIDTLFLPDRATAPSFGILLAAAQVPRERITILGSSDWAGDGAIAAEPYLSGALFASLDPAGLATFGAQYRARFGSAPHPLATMAHNAVLLAGNPQLAGAMPPYGPQTLLSPTGFSGRDGLFRFHHDGRGEYGLVVNRVIAGGAQIADPARLVGITREAAGTSSSGGTVIPPVGSSLVQRPY